MEIKEYIDQNKERFLEELKEILRIPSISANSDYKPDMQKCSEKIKLNLEKIGLDNVEILKTKGHPVIFGEKIFDLSIPTVLVYGHYDVQPPDPLDLWDSEPFNPVVKKTDIHPEGAIFARGANDDKGQVFMHIKAVEYLMKQNKKYCNIKFLIEGEEEIGSPSLEDFTRENKERLKCDVILVSDTGMIAKDIPTITTGLRGLSYLEVEVTGPNRDLHSGLYGGAVANPINILCNMIKSLHDDKGEINIPGFYDDVELISSEERKKISEIPFKLDNYKNSIGIEEVKGEDGYTTIERTSIRPSLDVNGIWGGYTGEGAKTVLPSKAFAKISARLVPFQNPDKISQLIKSHLEKIAPRSVKVNVKPHHGGFPYVTPMDNIGYKAANFAFKESFGKEPIPFRSGGSIPIIAMFENILGVKSILMGFGLDSDAIHSPNEHYGLFNFYKGIETIPNFYKYFREFSK